MSANFGPCNPWPVKWMCDVTTESPVSTGAAVMAATEVIWALSGRRFGACPVKLRPCRKTCRSTPFPNGWTPWPGAIAPPIYSGGSIGFGAWWMNAGCSTCGGSCDCGSLSEVELPAPVNTVTEVRVDGIVLTGSAYTLYDNRTLVRTDGGHWPSCQDLRANDTVSGTWSITATYGEDIPIGGQYAVGELACQYIKASNGEDCMLPKTVTSLARQGVTISMPVITDLLEKGKTGLYLTDFFLATVNPSGLHRASGVYSVDDALTRRPS